jgi:hypothetical protein
MAINPNTDFTAGQVLTAEQQNRFPRGIMALSLITTNAIIGNAESTFTSVTFTAAADRYYKISWFSGQIDNTSSSVNNFYFRQTTATGTIIQQGLQFLTAGEGHIFELSSINTFSAGSQSIFARFSQNAGSNTTMNSSATRPSYLMVEDIGPA